MNKTSISKAIVGICIGTWLGLGWSAVAKAAPAVTPARGAVFKPLATCNDGQVMQSSTGDHRGACSGHGGVKAWADGSPVKSKVPHTRYGK